MPLNYKFLEMIKHFFSDFPDIEHYHFYLQNNELIIELNVSNVEE